MQYIHANMGKNIVVILHIYGASAILPLFCYHQDTESEEREMKFFLGGPILS